MSSSKAMSLRARGKDIQSFKDLPAEVQASIRRQSDIDADKFQKLVNTAIKYQQAYAKLYQQGRKGR